MVQSIHAAICSLPRMHEQFRFWYLDSVYHRKQSRDTVQQTVTRLTVVRATATYQSKNEYVALASLGPGYPTPAASLSRSASGRSLSGSGYGRQPSELEKTDYGPTSNVRALYTVHRTAVRLIHLLHP
jgi:hypothetical protein